MVYGSELWVENKSKKKKLQAVEMDYLRRCARKSKLERVPSEETRRIMQAEGTILCRIDARKLRWFGHVMRMPEERWPAIIHSWIPPEEGRGDDLGGHGGVASEAVEKRGWGKKTPTTGYFGEEDWEGGGQPYKPIYIYIYDRAIGVRSPAGAKDFSSILCVQTGSGAHPASPPMGTGDPFPGGKARPRRDADH
jgi:hypothetical protein